ncbi:MAG: hypothetical protein R3C05_10825 [Pirellulaceae bacterium]
MPDPPTGADDSVAQVGYQQSSDFVDGSYYEQPADYGCSTGQCGPTCDCRQPKKRSCLTLIHQLQDLLDSRGCPPPLACNIRQAPAMLGGGFGGSSFQTLQGAQFVQGPNLVAVGTGVIPANQANSSLLFDVLGNAANPDFNSVGTGVQNVNGQFVFNVEEAVAGTNLGLPANTTFANATATEIVNGTIVNGELWNIAITGLQTFNIIIPDAANAGAAVVGRSKIATNNSPLPRTRAFMNYDLLSNVPLNNAGLNVSRFTPGMEFAFFNNSASIEFRVPYASTLSTDVRSDGTTNTSAIELGDIFLAYKQVLFQSTDIVFSGGVSVTLPSTNDLSLRLADGTPAMVVENQSVHVMPYFASIANLTDRVFYHGFIQVDVDATGNQLFTNQGLNTRLRDTARMYTDGGLGYFLRRRGEKRDVLFDSIVPTIELHYEQQLENGRSVTDGIFVLGNPNAGKQSNLNMVFGTTLEAGIGNAFSIGYAVPFSDSDESMFDGQLRAIWNRYF